MADAAYRRSIDRAERVIERAAKMKRFRANCNNGNNGEKLVYGRIARGWTPERVLNLTGEP
jgi:hypothetical protein